MSTKLNLLKILDFQNQELSMEAIDFIIDKSIEKIIFSFLCSSENKWQSLLLDKLSSPNAKLELLGEDLYFYGTDHEVIKQRVFASFARYDGIVATYRGGVSGGIGKALFNYKIHISPELQEKARLEEKVSLPSDSLEKIILKI